TVDAQGRLTSANNTSIEAPEIIEKFSLNNATPTNRTVGVYNGIITTSGSTIEFHLTANGTSGGTALFSNLNLSDCIFQLTVARNTTSNSESPWAHVRQILNTGRTVQVQVKRSNTGNILLGGS